MPQELKIGSPYASIRVSYKIHDRGLLRIADVDSLTARVRNALTSQPQPTVTVLSSLLAVADELGYIPEEAVAEVARFTHATVNDVWGVASFYTNFRFSPPARHKVEVCWGVSCHVVGAMRVAKEIADLLGLPGEGDGLDGSVSLAFNTCLGACAQGPVVSIDHQLIGRVTPQKARRLILDLAPSPIQKPHG